MKTKLEALTLNKDLQLNKKYKDIIISAENGRYSYFDYSKDVIQNIANNNLSDIDWEDCAYLLQALFPQYLICSGLFDSFLMFEIENGKRSDPPKYFYKDLQSFLNNGEGKTQYNYLGNEIIDLFKANGIRYNSEWDKLQNKDV